MSTYTLLTPKARDTAYACGRGDYQDALIRGGRSWAGSDLTGAAARNGGSYAASRAALIARMQEAGLSVERTAGARGRIIVVVMTAAERKRARDRPAAEVAAAIIEKAAKARASAQRKADREAAKAAHNLAEDIPILEFLAHAR